MSSLLPVMYSSVGLLKLSFQTVGRRTSRPAALRCSCAPPIPVTSGSLSGQDVTGCRK